MRAKASIPAWGKAASGLLCGVLAGCASVRSAPSICDAMQSVSERLVDGERAHIEVLTPRDIEVLACRANDEVSRRRLCPSAIEHTSFEFPQTFAWAVHDCIDQHGEVTLITTGDTASGLRDRSYITALDGRLGRAVEIEFRAERDDLYSLVISR